MKSKMAPEADEKIGDAFIQVKHLVYYDDPKGMWRKYNAEYGFNRNLLGCKYLWIALSVVGVIICGFCWHFTGIVHTWLDRSLI